MVEEAFSDITKGIAENLLAEVSSATSEFKD